MVIRSLAPARCRLAALAALTVAVPLSAQMPADPAEQAAAAADVYGPVAPPATERAATPLAIPPALDRAAALALAAHPRIDSAEAEARALDAELTGARWRRFPSLSVEALAATSGSSLADQDGLAVNLALEQPVWAGGRITNEIERAEASRDAGEGRVAQTRQAVILEVVSAYYDYILAQERVVVLEQSLAQHNTLLASIGRRVDQEVSPLADFTLGRSRTAQVELDLAQTREKRDSARVRLSELTGTRDVSPGLPLPEAPALLPPEDTALAEALTCDPGLRVLSSLIGVANAQRDIARSQLLPQVLLQLSQNEITGARAAVVMRMQLGSGGAQFAAIDSASARIDRAIADILDAQRQLRDELQRDYILVRSATDRVAAGADAAEAADQIVASYQRQFIAGRRSWLDVMNAVREAASARLNESDARVLAALGSARVLTLTCRWQPSDAGMAQ